MMPILRCLSIRGAVTLCVGVTILLAGLWGNTSTADERAPEGVDKSSRIKQSAAAPPTTGGVSNTDRQVSETPTERVIVLQSGKVLTGLVSRMPNAPGVITLEAGVGRVVISTEEIEVIASSLRDAYRQRRELYRWSAPAARIQLANWCIAYRLTDEAREELRRILKDDPDLDEARRLLDRVEETLKTRKLVKDPPVVRGADGFVVPEVESLGGLSKDLATAYTMKVQPLLMNQCATAGCHHTAATNDFKLNMVRLDSHGSRLQSERNLAAVLKYIDTESPRQSPLLRVPQGNHGRNGTTLFGGPNGSKQLQMLTEWVDQVAEARGGHRDERELAANAKRGPTKAASGTKGSSAKGPSGVTLAGHADRGGARESDRDRGQHREEEAESDSTASVRTAQHEVMEEVATTRNGRGGSADRNSASKSGRTPAVEPPPKTLTNDPDAKPVDRSNKSESASVSSTTLEPELADDPFSPDRFNRHFHGTTRRRQ